MTLEPEAAGRRTARRHVPLIDPGAIDLGSGHGLARLSLMLTTIFERLTAVDAPRDRDA